jgi:hypothetical protein
MDRLGLHAVDLYLLRDLETYFGGAIIGTRNPPEANRKSLAVPDNLW